MKRGFGLFAACAPLFSSAWGQSFNVDLDTGFGPPEGGRGVPSDQFGAAANQPGRWNRIGLTERGPAQLLGLDGLPTAVTYEYDTHGGSTGGGGNLFAGNTGDFALLLNDYSQVAPIISGGHVTYWYRNLAAGHYQVITYAVDAFGRVVGIPVTVTQSATNPTQTITGPMPGNSFAYLVTHSAHEVELTDTGDISIDIVAPPQTEDAPAFVVNGFQIRAVPEQPSSVSLVALVLLLWAGRLKK